MGGRFNPRNAFCRDFSWFCAGHFRAKSKAAGPEKSGRPICIPRALPGVFYSAIKTIVTLAETISFAACTTVPNSSVASSTPSPRIALAEKLLTLLE